MFLIGSVVRRRIEALTGKAKGARLALATHLRANRKDAARLALTFIT